MKQLLAILILGTTMLLSCKKQKGDVVVLKGRILNSADSTAIRNTNWAVYQTWQSSYNKTEERNTPFTTDTNGYFNFSYQLSGRVIVICWPEGINKPIARVQLDMGGVSEHNFGTIYAENPQ